MVQTHYQLLNTLQMTYDEVEQLVKPSLDYANMIKIDPAALKEAPIHKGLSIPNII